MGIFFKLFNGLHIFIYRLSGGRLGGAIGGAKILLLTTKGRKSADCIPIRSVTSSAMVAT